MVSIEGNPLKPGKYALFTIPNEDVWTVILNRDYKLWGAYDRKPEEDVLKVKASRGKVPEKVETFTIWFEAVTDDKARLVLMWENTRVDVVIEAPATEQGLRNIDEALAKPDADFRAYNSSARFCVDRNVRLPEALGWAQKSVGMEKKYWNAYTLALAYGANGRFKEAIDAANESMSLAQAEKDAAYVKMCRERIQEWTGAGPASTGGAAKPAKK
jgi:hypothetical protein